MALVFSWNKGKYLGSHLGMFWREGNWLEAKDILILLHLINT